MDPDGEEQWRIEGFLPKDEFRAQLEMALARLDVMNKDWKKAEKRFTNVASTYANTSVAPEAMYWRNVSRYSQSHDATPLQEVAKELREKFPESVWTKKASVWGG
jgi:outer membrane protein assembly factor BamD (BamD/ComL family)